MEFSSTLGSLNRIEGRSLAPLHFLHSQMLFSDVMTPACTYDTFCYQLAVLVSLFLNYMWFMLLLIAS